jgi:hypothetical protein
MAAPMTRGERTDLARLVRQRAKVEKAGAAQRRAEILADFERQLASIYTPDDDAAFAELHAAAAEAVEDAKAKLRERCDELGIPARFAPSLKLHWYGRGENALKDRRTELRRVAVTRLDAMEKAAKTDIERASVDAQTRLVADGLTTETARSFLAELPSIGELMPTLDASAVAGVLGNGGP